MAKPTKYWRHTLRLVWQDGTRARHYYGFTFKQCDGAFIYTQTALKQSHMQLHTHMIDLIHRSVFGALQEHVRVFEV